MQCSILNGGWTGVCIVIPFCRRIQMIIKKVLFRKLCDAGTDLPNNVSMDVAT